MSATTTLILGAILAISLATNTVVAWAVFSLRRSVREHGTAAFLTAIGRRWDLFSMAAVWNERGEATVLSPRSPRLADYEEPKPMYVDTNNGSAGGAQR